MHYQGDQIRSVNKASEVLRAFAPDNTPLGVTELGHRLGLHKSTVHRFLRSLETNGFVCQDPKTGKYSLDISMLEFAGFITCRMEIIDTALPLLYELNQSTGETANLAVPSGSHIVNVKQVISRRRVRADGWIGRRLPLGATAAGRAVLSGFPNDRLEAFLKAMGNLAQAQHLAMEVQSIRERGYAISLEEFEPGLCAVSAPVFDYQGRVVGAIGLMGPSFRFVGSSLEQSGVLAVKAAKEVTKRLFYMAEEA